MSEIVAAPVPAGGEDVVDHQHAITRSDGIRMNLECVVAVFEGVTLPDRVPRQLAGLSHRNEPGTNPGRHRTPDDETPRLDADHMADPVRAPRRRQFLDRAVESLCVPQQRGDVLEHDPGLRKIRHIANKRTKFVHPPIVRGRIPGAGYRMPDARCVESEMAN